MRQLECQFYLVIYCKNLNSISSWLTKSIQLLRAKQNYLKRYSYADLAFTYRQIFKERRRETENIEAECNTWNCPTDKIQKENKGVRSKNIMSCFLSSSSMSLLTSSTGCLFSSVSFPSRMAWTLSCGFPSLDHERRHQCRIWGLQRSQKKHSYIPWPDSSLLL